jgi:hypothetical protein
VYGPTGLAHLHGGARMASRQVTWGAAAGHVPRARAVCDGGPRRGQARRPTRATLSLTRQHRLQDPRRTRRHAGCFYVGMFCTRQSAGPQMPGPSRRPHRQFTPSTPSTTTVVTSSQSIPCYPTSFTHPVTGRKLRRARRRRERCGNRRRGRWWSLRRLWAVWASSFKRGSKMADAGGAVHLR